jgi:hypothetical protein
LFRPLLTKLRPSRFHRACFPRGSRGKIAATAQERSSAVNEKWQKIDNHKIDIALLRLMDRRLREKAAWPANWRGA